MSMPKQSGVGFMPSLPAVQPPQRHRIGEDEKARLRRINGELSSVLERIAAISHCGGWAGHDGDSALLQIRRLSYSWQPKTREDFNRIMGGGK